jgi:hypothetical protein
MNCKFCGQESALGSLFCSACGSKLENAAPAAIQEPEVKEVNKPVPVSSKPMAKTKTGLGKKLIVGFAGVMALFLVIGIFAPKTGSGSNLDGSETGGNESTWEPVSFTEFSTSVELVKLSKTECKPFAKTAASSKTIATAKKRIKAMNKADGNAWSAYSYVAKNSWTSTPGASLDNWKSAWDAQVGKYFDDLTAAVMSNAEIIKSKDALLPELSSKIVLDCSLGNTISKTQLTFESVSTKGSAIVSLADTKPWYPKGYREWEDGLAWKWVDAYEDCYSCRYNHIKVVSRDGCSGGIYAEVNFERGGSVVDWTNDSIPYLGAGSKALLVFRTYSSGSLSTSLTTLNCHY